MDQSIAVELLDHLAGADLGPSEAWARLEAEDLSDGLPVGGPSSDLLAEMIRATGRTASDVVAVVPPLRQELTVRRLAVCAALAGCSVEHMPILRMAAGAMVEPRLNLLGVSTTTSSAALLCVVSGPVSGRLRFNGGANCFGPGNRSNATVGRCISLICRLVGGAREGVMDMATMGQPAKYGFCFAENAGNSPWEPMHVDQGIPADRSAVTLLGVAGTLEAFDSTSSNPTELVESLARPLATSAPIGLRHDGLIGGGFPTIVLSPEWAHLFASSGMTKRDLQRDLLAAATAAHPDVRVAEAAEDILVVVAGGHGLKQTVIPGWAGGSAPVSVEV